MITGFTTYSFLLLPAVTPATTDSSRTSLFWDDAPANVESARLFGWQAEHYTTFEHFQDRMQELN